MRSDLDVILTAIDNLPETDLPALFGEIERRKMLWLKPTSNPIQTTTPDQLLSVDVAAQRLGVSTDYVYRHAGQFPFTRRVGRKLLFSERGLDAYLRTASNKSVLTAKQQRRTIGV